MPPVTLDGAKDSRLWIRGLAPEPVSFALRVRYRAAGASRVCTSLDTPGPDGTFHCRHLELAPAQRHVGSALALGWRLTNTSSELVSLDEVVLEACARTWPLLREPSRLRLYQHGYQSWTPSGSVAGDARPSYPLVRSFALMNHYVDSPFWGRRDGLISSLFTLLKRSEASDGVLVGYLTQRVGLGEIFFENRGEPSLHASLDYGGRVLAPGETLLGEELYLEVGQPDALLLAYAGTVARSMEARVPPFSPVGWCSWYQYYTRVNHGDMVRNTDFLAEHPELGVSFVQLDDGYQSHVGDWLELNDKFPDGLPPLTGHIRERGFRAGIWTAPFFATSGSRLLREHPAWFLDPPDSSKGYAGRPVATGFNPEWRARTWALDLTHPQVLEWLERVFSTLVEQGFDYFKIDFLFAGLRHGRRHHVGFSPTEAYRHGLAAIRRGIGEGRFLLGCGAPIGPSIGFVDGMRVSQDVKEQWDSGLANFVGKGCGYPAAKGALRTNMTRWFMHRTWWVNDPDCLLVRDHDTKLDKTETETLVSLLCATGGMLFLSDDMPKVKPDRLRLAGAALPPSKLVGRPGDTMAGHYPDDMVVEGEGGRRLVVLVNWKDSTVSRPLPDVEIEGGWFDHWHEAMVDPGPLEIPRHGVRVLRFVPLGPEPALVGDNLHLVAQVDGRIQDSFDPATGTFTLRARDVASREGKLWLYLPSGWDIDPERLPADLRIVERGDRVIVLALEATPPWERALVLVERS